MQTETQPTACGTLQSTFVNVVDDVRGWAGAVMEGVSGFDDVYDTRVDIVPNVAYDGFIPFTDGGFDACGYATISAAYGSGSVPAAIQPILDGLLKDARQEWDKAHPDATVDMIYAVPEPVALENDGQLVLPGVISAKESKWRRREHPLREKWHEHQDCWLQEGTTYFYKARVLFYDIGNSSNVTGKPEAYFFVGINTDLEYGRDNIPWLSCYGGNPQQSKWCWERNVPLEDITEELMEQLATEAINALNDL